MYAKQYYAEHVEKRLAYQNKYNKEHLEERRAYDHAYRKKHGPRQKERQPYFVIDRTPMVIKFD